MVGRTLGRYRIVEKLGAGAMGEVYRACDTTLSRDVAIKVLPGRLMSDPDRRARLAREARLLASLNHPNVGAIYGFEEVDGVSALVLELIEGPTLADRLASGALAVGEAIDLARQIANALDAAHERGIVHRDLKPANIKIGPDGVVKVLDFGLAIASGGGSGSEVSLQSTIMVTGIRDGLILGTAAYMSPEQARGQAVDQRTDIWAFGCVLYEMLTGQTLFARDTVTDTLAAILEREPSWTALPAGTSAGVRRLLRRCSEKDVKRRLRDIGDARVDLDDDGGESYATSAGTTKRTLWAALAIACLAAGLGAGWLARSRSQSSETPAINHWMLDVRPATSLLGGVPLERSILGRWRPSRTAMALAPDGRTLAFTAHRDGEQKLYVRAIDKPEAAAIPGTDGANNPFFSPDGAWIGFWAAGALRKVPLAGGPPAKLCDASSIYGASWGDDDRIVFSQQNTIWRIAASAGGPPEELTKRPAAGGEARHLLPQVLPGGKWLLFTLQTTINEWEGSQIVAQSLATGERKVILEGAADARYVPTGHLVFMRLGTLAAVPFDANRLELEGAEVAIVPDVMQSINSGIPQTLDTGAGQFAFSQIGTLVYVEGGIQADSVNTLQWLRRDGSVEPIPAPARAYFLPRLSPDERQLVVGTTGLRDQNLWRYDIASRTLSRLTSEGRAEHPVWSRDGARIAFSSSLKGFQHLFVTRSDGGAAPQEMTSGTGAYFPGAWTPDDRSLVITRDSGDIALMSLEDRKVEPILATRFRENMPDLSPDGRWLAYVSNETGRSEVYVQGLAGEAGKRLISVNGGTEPMWSRNGRKLIFISEHSSSNGDLRQVVEVDVTTAAQFTAGTPHVLFDLDATHYGSAAQTHNYDVTADAQRFLFVHETVPQNGASPRELQIVQNWFTELKQRVAR